jgi:ribose transport system substrate-binding protein
LGADGPHEGGFAVARAGVTGLRGDANGLRQRATGVSPRCAPFGAAYPRQAGRAPMAAGIGPTAFLAVFAHRELSMRMAKRLNREKKAGWRVALTSMALLLGALVLPAGGHPAQAADQKGKKVALLMTGVTLPVPAGVKAAFLERAKTLGLEVTSFEQFFDAARQAQQMDDAIARKFDIIAVMPVSEQSIVPSLLRAKQAKVPVIIINSPPKDGTEDLYLSFIGEDAVQMGRLAGQSILQALKDAGRTGGKVALITGSLQEGVAPRRLAGIKEVLAAHKEVQLVAVEDAKWDPVATERVAGQLFARYAPQGGLDVIYGMNDDQAVAIIRAAEAAGIPLGLKPKQLIVTGGNCSADGLKMIRAGKEYSTGVQGPARTGAGAADLVADYFQGKKLKKLTLQPIDTVTRANIDKWQATCNY